MIYSDLSLLIKKEKNKDVLVIALENNGKMYSVLQNKEITDTENYEIISVHNSKKDRRALFCYCFDEIICAKSEFGDYFIHEPLNNYLLKKEHNSNRKINSNTEEYLKFIKKQIKYFCT